MSRDIVHWERNSIRKRLGLRIALLEQQVAALAGQLGTSRDAFEKLNAEALLLKINQEALGALVVEQADRSLWRRRRTSLAERYAQLRQQRYDHHVARVAAGCVGQGLRTLGRAMEAAHAAASAAEEEKNKEEEKCPQAS